MNGTNPASFYANLQSLNHEAAKLKSLDQPQRVAIVGKTAEDKLRKALGDIHSNSNRHGIANDSTKTG